MTGKREEILRVIIDIYKKHRRNISSDEISNATKFGRGIIRRELAILKCMGLIESCPGPKGGYKPVLRIFDNSCDVE
ncbi:MAG TPA: HTH domain-containing protein [Candidatus Altiarchaeales archaeon]|nr:HTH domain-containing protein [Candidatus Altiarchaeales archaeon]HEX55334.1 HTH domain-containing protein [Candidatus Altiarchaeales archaeon]